MVNKETYLQSATLTFKRWTRKKNAYLVTAGATINIASLSVCIVEQLDAKCTLPSRDAQAELIENSLAEDFEITEELEQNILVGLLEQPANAAISST